MPDSAVYPPNPSGPVLLGQSGAAVSHTGDTNETVLATIPVPANLPGKNGRMVVECEFERNSGGTATVQPRVRFGASGAGVGGTIMGTTGSFSNAQATVIGRVSIKNLNATNSQKSQSNNQLNVPYAISSGAFLTAAIDTTTASEIAITGKLGDSGDTITLVSYQVLAYPHA